MPRPNRGPQLSEEPNKAGYYEITWTERGRSRRHSTGKSDYREAQTYYARWLLALDEATDAAAAAAEQPDGLTVQEVCDYYVAEHVSRLPLAESRDRIPRRLALVCTQLGPLKVATLGRADIRAYVTAREEGKVVVPGQIDHRTGLPKVGQKAKASSCRNELAQLVAAIRFAVDDGKLKPTDAPKLKLPDPPAPRPIWLTREEAAKLLAANAPKEGQPMSRAYLLLVLGLSTAARKEAMQQLTWDRVDFVNNLIDFNQPGRPITKKRRVKLPMSATLRDVLERAYKERTTDHVLFHDGNTAQTFVFAAKRAGVELPEGAGVHLLRHTWATWQAQMGVSMTWIAACLGDTVQTTERHYAMHSPETLGHVVDGIVLPTRGVVDRLIEGAPGARSPRRNLRATRGVTPEIGVKTEQQSATMPDCALSAVGL